MSQTLEELKLLREAVERTAKSLGLEVLTSFVVPEDTNLPAHMQVSFKVLPEAIMTDEQKEQAGIDDQFNALMSGIDGTPEEKTRTKLEDLAAEYEAEIEKDEDLDEEG